MNILIVDLIKKPEEITAHVKPHSEWVKKYFDAGIFVAAGPKKNQLGGVILCKSMDKKKLQDIINEDPYVIEDVADYRVIDMDCKLATEALASLKAA